MTIKPTIENMKSIFMWEDVEDFELVDDLLKGRWRHGTEHQLIVKRFSDNTYWSITYRTDKDGDYNELRDDSLSESDIFQVEPKEKIIISWEPVKVST